MSDRLLHVLGCPAFSNRAWNPYNAALYEAAMQQDPNIRVEEYSLRRLLRGPCDVLHVHWLESVLNEPSAPRAARYAWYALNRLRLARLRGARVVWTAHNLRAHDALHPRIESWYWRRFLPQVDVHVHLTKTGRDEAERVFPSLRKKPGWIVPHGHYRPFYRNDVDQASARAALGLSSDDAVVLFFGRMRPYKGLPSLIQAFKEVHRKDARLLLAGQASPAFQNELEVLTGADDRIRMHADLVPDDEVQLWLNAADIVALPYRDIHFSGAAMLALSFDRPVLVPDLPVFRELRSEVGQEWVLIAETGLTGAAIESALDAAARCRGQRPGLGAFSWTEVGKRMADVFRAMAG